jgi:hypothetical protein
VTVLMTQVNVDDTKKKKLCLRVCEGGGGGEECPMMPRAEQGKNG